MTPNGPSRLDRVESVVEVLAQRMDTLTQRIDVVVDAVGALAEVQKRTEQRVQEGAASVEALKVSQQHTDERLNILIGIVDGSIRRSPPQPPESSASLR